MAMCLVITVPPASLDIRKSWPSCVNEVRQRRARPRLMPPRGGARLPNIFYVKLGAACFVLGEGCSLWAFLISLHDTTPASSGGFMELFMIHTGFYDV